MVPSHPHLPDSRLHALHLLCLVDRMQMVGVDQVCKAEHHPAPASPLRKKPCLSGSSCHSPTGLRYCLPSRDCRGPGLLPRPNLMCASWFTKPSTRWYCCYYKMGQEKGPMNCWSKWIYCCSLMDCSWRCGSCPVDKKSQAPMQRETAATPLTLPTLLVAECLQSSALICKLEISGDLWGLRQSTGRA